MTSSERFATGFEEAAANFLKETLAVLLLVVLVLAVCIVFVPGCGFYIGTNINLFLATLRHAGRERAVAATEAPAARAPARIRTHGLHEAAGRDFQDRQPLMEDENNDV